MNAPIRRLSPVEFSEESGEELGTVAYHFRTLDKAGCIEVVDEERRRGAVVHFYEPIKRAMAWTREWESLGPVVRQNLAATALRGAVESIGNAVDAGTFDAREDSHLSFDALWVDELGWTELHMIFQRALEEVLAVTFEVGERLKQNPQVPQFLASYVLSTFETADPRPEGG